MDPLTGSDPAHIGPFRMIGRLGAGGMGRVYLARSAGGRTVAVKLVHAELAAQDEFRRRFAREVAALERVGGTGTAPVLGADTEAEAPWVAIAYVAGPSLRDVIGGQSAGEYGPLPASSVLSLAAGLARALEHIHASGLVHRDLKPANVLLTVDGPRIIDFGIARAVDTVTDGGLTSTGAVVGSPGFMSPEQVRGERVTAASDLFCLGSVLAYAATGRSPFGAGDSGVHAMLFRIAHDEPDLEGLPAELDALVRACLDKDPAARPAAAALAAALTQADPWLPAEVLARLGRHAAVLLDADGDDARLPNTAWTTASTNAPTGDPIASAASASTPPPKPRRRGRVLIAAACTLAVLGAGGAAVALFLPEDGKGGRQVADKDGQGERPLPGVVPAAFLGAWEGVLKGAEDAPYETGRIEIAQGRPGEKTGVYVQVSGERLCMGRSTLVSANADEIVFGESDVTKSVPAKRCQPAPHQKLTVRSPDVLQWTSGTLTSTFRRAGSGPKALPKEMVGTWKNIPDTQIPADQRDLWSYRVTVVQGPVGAPLVRFEQSTPRRNETTGEPTSGSVNCTETSVVGGVGTLVILGPAEPEQGSDPDCFPDGSSRNLRIDRFEGKDRLLVYGMSADGEPGEYVRGF
ncbi:serine/threonine-protein kinase [Streptomyces sp. NPDC051907]|uniref:serine/threonine-protein kinase n=1 Tax=Streptomyces sp. NPDC051907 TaxID=3155284 RepID=UPI00343598EB